MAGYRKTKRDVLELFIHNLINNLLNVFLYLGYFFGKIFKGQHKQLLRNIELKDIYTGQRCFVLGNGPSLNNQKIELLKDEVVFMVNRSFLDPRYADISPKYHVIIDDKLSTGEWPITYLDEILNKNPNVIFLLNSKWFELDKFTKYKEKCEIYWIDQSLKLSNYSVGKTIDLTKRTFGGFVVEQGVIAASYMGFSDIFITGVDGDGFANLLLNQQSHSYGVNEDDIEKFSSWQGVRQSICSVCKWMLTWHYLDEYIISNKSKITNLSGRGIITMVATDEFTKIKK
jgi:hypothetical protein